jgi:hypothetical protein
MNNNRIPLQEFKYRPAGRRDRGRPSRGWKHQLHLEKQEQAGEVKCKLLRQDKKIPFMLAATPTPPTHRHFLQNLSEKEPAYPDKEL